MKPLIEQLRNLSSRTPKRFKGQLVKRTGDDYEIDGASYDLDGAVAFLNQMGAPPKGLDYDWTVFFECKPYSTVAIKQHRVRTKAEHAALVEAVRSRKHYLYYASVHKNGTTHFAFPVLLVDWDSIPDVPYGTVVAAPPPPDPKKWAGGLTCPFCAKTVTSTPGRTLHVKAQHPDRLAEYATLLQAAASPKQAAASPKPVAAEDDEEDVLTHLEPTVGLSCPFCSHRVTSTPGRTLHVKSKHPEQLAQYRQRFQ